MSHEKFHENLRNYCENPQSYSIKPFMNKNSGVETLIKIDKAYTESIIESCQFQCFFNVVTTWANGKMSSLEAIVFINENSQEFRDYFTHVKKFEVIESEEQAKSVINRFVSLDVMFKALSRKCENHKGYNAKNFIEEETGFDYEKILARGLISKDWGIVITIVHSHCLCNVDRALLHGTLKKTGELSEKKTSEYFAEDIRWERIKEKKEQPKTCKETLFMDNITSASLTGKVTIKDEFPLSEANKKLIAKYQDRLLKANDGFEFSEKKTEDGKVVLKFKFNERLTKDLIAATYFGISGSTQKTYIDNVLGRVASTFFSDKRRENATSENVNSIIGALLDMAPVDVTDGILCRRILTLENQSNEYFGRAANSEHLDVIDRNINNATKLSRLLNETIEARARYLKKGEQKYTVTHQHVEVHGGQTVIGDVSKRRRASEK